MTPETAARLQTIAAWVQAVGSLLAVCVAIYVPYRIAVNAEKASDADRLVKERSLLLSLREQGRQLDHELSIVRAILNGATEPDIAAGVTQGMSLYIKGHDIFGEDLTRLTPNLTAPTGTLLLDLVAAIHAYNNELLEHRKAQEQKDTEAPEDRKSVMVAAAERCLIANNRFQARVKLAIEMQTKKGK